MTLVHYVTVDFLRTPICLHLLSLACASSQQIIMAMMAVMEAQWAPLKQAAKKAGTSPSKLLWK